MYLWSLLIDQKCVIIVHEDVACSNWLTLSLSLLVILLLFTIFFEYIKIISVEIFTVAQSHSGGWFRWFPVLSILSFIASLCWLHSLSCSLTVNVLLRVIDGSRGWWVTFSWGTFLKNNLKGDFFIGLHSFLSNMNKHLGISRNVFGKQMIFTAAHWSTHWDHGISGHAK